jgi:hypothetical protein
MSRANRRMTFVFGGRSLSMDIFDLLWNVSQERRLEELRGHYDRLRLEHDLSTSDLGKVKELAEENLELKLRLGLLVRLLITKGVITAQEYAALIAQTDPKSPSARLNPSSQQAGPA